MFQILFPLLSIVIFNLSQTLNMLYLWLRDAGS